MSDDLEQMTPNQRRALNKALSVLEAMAAIWASEIRLTDMSQRIADVPDAAERAKRIAAMIEQGFIEGAYRHYLDHKDEILHVDALEAANARIAELEARTATVAPAVDAQPVACARIYADNTCGLSWIAPAYSMLPVGEHNLYASAQSEGWRKDAERYRWLVKNCFDWAAPGDGDSFDNIELHFEHDMLSRDDDSVGAAIDAEIAREAGSR